jgi:peptide/nickel transport system permease protein
MVIVMKKDNTQKTSQFRSIVRRFMKNKLAVVGMVIFVMLLLMMVCADWIVPYDMSLKPDLQNRLLKPCPEHPFGADEMGRDVFARVVHGSRRSISIGLIVTAISAGIGCILGAISGYYGGKVDIIMMRFGDVLMSIPYMLFCITVISFLGLGMRSLIIAMSTAIMPGYARLIRASVLSLKDVEFIEAAIATGCSTPRILFKHIIPNVIGPIIVKATVGTASVILGAAGLSFIGLGIQPPTPEWGTMMSTGRTYMRTAPYLIVIPGIFIMITTLSLNLMGDGLRDALDPRLKN